jgi:hypothetical protein
MLWLAYYGLILPTYLPTVYLLPTYYLLSTYLLFTYLPFTHFHVTFPLVLIFFFNRKSEPV